MIGENSVFFLGEGLYFGIVKFINLVIVGIKEICYIIRLINILFKMKM